MGRSSSTCTPGAACSTRSSRVHLPRGGRANDARVPQGAHPDTRTVPLCGNSIGTDRRFLAAYLPEIEEFLHYRSVDVSTIKELIRRWNPALLNDARASARPPPRPRRHPRERRELAYYRDHFFVRPGAGGGTADTGDPRESPTATGQGPP
jgi:oligoribonuclease